MKVWKWILHLKGTGSEVNPLPATEAFVRTTVWPATKECSPRWRSTLSFHTLAMCLPPPPPPTHTQCNLPRHSVSKLLGSTNCCKALEDLSKSIPHHTLFDSSGTINIPQCCQVRCTPSHIRWHLHLLEWQRTKTLSTGHTLCAFILLPAVPGCPKPPPNKYSFFLQYVWVSTNVAMMMTNHSGPDLNCEFSEDSPEIKTERSCL